MKLMPTGHERAELEAGTELSFGGTAITVKLKLKVHHAWMNRL